MSGRDYAVLYLGSGKDRRSTAAGGNVLEPSGTPKLDAVLLKGNEAGTKPINAGAGLPLELNSGTGTDQDSSLNLAPPASAGHDGGPATLRGGGGAAGYPGGDATLGAGNGNDDATTGARVVARSGDNDSTNGRLEFLSDASTGDAGQVPTADGDGGWTWEDPTGGGGGGGSDTATQHFTATGGTPETFTLSDTPVGERRVYVNGARLPNASVGGTGTSVEVNTVAGDTVTVDYDVAGSGGGSMPSGSAVGDLLVWDGAAWQLLGVGADDEVLTVDSGEALGAKWSAPTGAGASFSIWSPTLTATSSNPTLGSGSSAAGRYTQIGDLVTGTATFVFGSSGVAAGSGQYTIDLPVPDAGASNDPVIGTGFIYDSSVGTGRLVTAQVSGGLVYLWLDAGVVSSLVGHNSPWTWAAGDVIQISFSYEAA